MFTPAKQEIICRTYLIMTIFKNVKMEIKKTQTLSTLSVQKIVLIWF